MLTEESPLQNNIFKCPKEANSFIHNYTYISMKIDPNGSMPPSTTIILGSINLNKNIVYTVNIQSRKWTT